MRALVRNKRVRLEEHAIPDPAHNDVLLRVHCAGVCRTDVFVMDGALPVTEPRIPGHELVGEIVALGDAVRSVSVGSIVTALPMLACGTCAVCAPKPARDAVPLRRRCLNEGFLGVHRDGAFAEFVTVPAVNVRLLPPNLNAREGAYVEPLAAALSVLRAPIAPEMEGVVLGRNRIATLTMRVLQTAGFTKLTQVDPTELQSLPDQTFDFAVETSLSSQTMMDLTRVLIPGGHIVLRSRIPGVFPFEPTGLMSKEITVHAHRYGSFEHAMDWIAQSRVQIQDLFGEVYPLREFEQVISIARHEEITKLFFDPRIAS